MLELERIPPARFPDVSVKSPANWTAVAFLGLLGAVHLSIAIPAACHGRWEGSVSFLFAAMFILAGCIARNFGVETAVFPSRRQIRVRTGTRRFYAEKTISFSAVAAVRLTRSGPAQLDARIEIVCDGLTLELPPTPVAAQEALFFAMMIEVEFVKVGVAEVPSIIADISDATLPKQQVKEG